MKKHCIYCGQVIEQDQTECPKCNKKIINIDISSKDDQQALLLSISEEDKHLIHRNCHQNINKANADKNTSLVFLVTGGILLVIGLLFLLLSFRYNIYKKRVFSPGTVEFVVCVVSLSVCAIFGVIGSIKLIKAIKLKKKSQELIDLTK